jgi:hypothetical protein
VKTSSGSLFFDTSTGNFELRDQSNHTVTSGTKAS